MCSMTIHGSGTTLEHHWDHILSGIVMNQTTLKGLSIAEQATSTDHLRKLFMVTWAPLGIRRTVRTETIRGTTSAAKKATSC